jgi:membrane-associated phospholipid phosphatase
MRRLYPGSVWYVAPVLYGGAALVGVSRMYHNKHWASDVVLGAAVGTFSGLKVVRYSHTHPDNKLDRFMLHTSIATTSEGGAALMWSLPAP